MANTPSIHIAAQMASAKELTLADARDHVLAEIEEQYLRLLLIRHQGSVSSSAESAGVSASYLCRLIKKRGINPNQYREKKRTARVKQK